MRKLHPLEVRVLAHEQPLGAAMTAALEALIGLGLMTMFGLRTELGHKVLETVRALRTGVENPELVFFHNTLATAMEITGLGEYDVSGELPVSVTTVRRWINGVSAPRPLMRKPVYHFFLARIVGDE